MTWGNSLFAAGEFDPAGNAFRRVTRLSPDNPRGWNNLAYALLETGCPQQAQQAAVCAVKSTDVGARMVLRSSVVVAAAVAGGGGDGIDSAALATGGGCTHARGLVATRMGAAGPHICCTG